MHERRYRRIRYIYMKAPPQQRGTTKIRPITKIRPRTTIKRRPKDDQGRPRRPGRPYPTQIRLVGYGRTRSAPFAGEVYRAFFYFFIFVLYKTIHTTCLICIFNDVVDAQHTHTHTHTHTTHTHTTHAHTQMHKAHTQHMHVHTCITYVYPSWAAFSHIP